MIAHRLPLFIVVCLFLGCSPASFTRIGPTVPARSSGCGIEILSGEEKPSRPYRDIGMVSLENCQDYREYPCRKWLEESACELGGQVAYRQEEERPKSNIGPVTYQIFIAVYIADAARGEPGKLGTRGADCEKEAAKKEKQQEELAGRCLE